ncbi:MAG: elongation factor G [Desulfuromonadales bacterium]|nr:elongation factor G [Desulfuromonadales bacterium]
MSQPILSQIRNIGIISHIDAGKTTVSERILFYCGEIHKLGEVHDGMATMDWMAQEQDRGITITATSTTCRWQDTWINLIDTPGHIDFTIEVERSLRVLDGAIAIFSAVEGVQPQSESVWRQASRYDVPRICLINKMDRIGADYRAVLEQMQARLGARPVLMQLPLGEEGSFRGVIDLLEGCELTFDEGEFGATVVCMPVADELKAEVAEAREAIVEAAADWDDDLLADFLDGQTIAAERIRPALRKGVLAGQLFPVFLGSALRNKGVQPLLDAVTDLLPSPLEMPPVPAHQPGGAEDLLLPCDESGPFCALAFKVLSDEGRKLTYLRIYSGELKAGGILLNGNRNVQERAARLFRMHAHKRERIDVAFAGDIVAAAGLKEALTGDTLCSPEQPLLLAGLAIPEPVVSLAVEVKQVQDRDKLLLSLEKLQWEDPTFRVREDEETGQTVLTGMGELHLEVVLRRLADDFGVEVNAGKPQVVYRESVSAEACHTEIFEREIDGKLQRGEVSLRVAPRERGSGIQIVLPPSDASGLSADLLAVLDETLRLAVQSGVQVGYPMVDLSLVVERVPVTPGVTSALGLRAAAQRGLSLAARAAKPVLLEPVMALEITSPNEFSGKVLGNLQQKRGRVEGMESRDVADIVRAHVPLSEMFGYMTELRSATQGRGSFTMEFSHYDKAPDAVLKRFGLK